MGELRALSHLGSEYADDLTPLVEIPLTAADTDSDLPDATTVSADPVKFADNLRKSWSPERRIIVDASLAPFAAAGEPATVELINSLAPHNIDVTPTVRPSDLIETIEAVQRVTTEWKLNSACIRLSGDDLDDTDIPLSRSIEDVLELLQLPPDRVDLVLDSARFLTISRFPSPHVSPGSSSARFRTVTRGARWSAHRLAFHLTSTRCSPKY